MNKTEIAVSIPDALDRIAALNGAYRAFSHVSPEIGAPSSRGPLRGLAISVKGNIPVAGLPWTEGSAMYADRIATHDALIVARARAEGAVVVGTTTLSELAMYGVENPFEPMGLNPWDVRRTAGGSSTGAGVAAALRMAHINIGTDSGGSIRNPACHCGVVGFMPRIGALPLQGTPNHAPSLSAIGLVCPTAAEIETAYAVLAQVAPAPRAYGRLLVPRTLIEQMCDDETRALFSAALAQLAAAGFALVEADIPGWLEGERAAGIVSLHESGGALSRMEVSKASEGIRLRAAAAVKLSLQEVDGARRACAALRAEVAGALRREKAEGIVTPTWPFAAPPIQAQTVMVGGKTVPVDPHRNCFVRAANAIDACAITLPMGLYEAAGVPAGLHLMAEGGNETRLLAMARLVEAALPALPLPPPLRAGP